MYLPVVDWYFIIAYFVLELNYSFLQTGDILITYSTDIGWTPYFPLLAGVVTEIGGLISHGGPLYVS